MDRELIAQALRQWRDLRDRDADPELEAVRLAIVVEDVLGDGLDRPLADEDIDLAVLSDVDAVAELGR